ncbi:hypothetical protein ACFXTI_003682 [Malus domestica]
MPPNPIAISNFWNFRSWLSTVILTNPNHRVNDRPTDANRETGGAQRRHLFLLLSSPNPQIQALEGAGVQPNEDVYSSLTSSRSGGSRRRSGGFWLSSSCSPPQTSSLQTTFWTAST